MSLPRLVALPYSPWSIRAKWALDHHGVDYRYLEYLPMLGEPLLKLRTGRWRGRTSVPVLLTDDGAIEGSWDIARFADRSGDGETLFPEGRDADIERWDARAETILRAGRALAMRRMLRSPRALAEHVPGGRALGTVVAPVGALGVHYLLRKYGVTETAEHYRSAMRAGLEALRDALGKGDHPIGVFSYATLTMAVSLTFKPLGPGRDHLGEANRACWTDAELAEEFADLVAWRDRVWPPAL